MPKYRVTQDVNLSVGVESLHCKEDDVIELTEGQAALHPHYLELVEEPKPRKTAKRGKVVTKMVEPEEADEE